MINVVTSQHDSITSFFFLFCKKRNNETQNKCVQCKFLTKIKHQTGNLHCIHLLENRKITLRLLLYNNLSTKLQQFPFRSERVIELFSWLFRKREREPPPSTRALKSPRKNIVASRWSGKMEPTIGSQRVRSVSVAAIILLKNPAVTPSLTCSPVRLGLFLISFRSFV